jgi:catechol 2,3-dioxygenase-like lactoylglutathione lyase family enzyme
MKSTVIGVIFRVVDKQKTALFYQKLGVELKEHEHGGPKHFEMCGLSDMFVLEIYQNSPTFLRDAIMVRVASIEKAIEAVAEFSAIAKTKPKTIGSNTFVYINDPDGRDVMLVEDQNLTKKKTT